MRKKKPRKEEQKTNKTKQNKTERKTYVFLFQQDDFGHHYT